MSNRTLIWYRSPECYRLELVDWPCDDLRTYFVRSGNCVFSTIAKRDMHNEPKWEATPAFWSDENMLSSILQPTWRLQDTALVGLEQVHSVSTEHWHNHSTGMHSTTERTVDVWLSINRQFPLVMKAQTHGPNSSMHWEITQLHIDESIPGKMFTAQVHPANGLSSQLKMQYKPLWMILLWYVLLLSVYTWMIFALAMPKLGRMRVLHIVGSAVGMLVMLWVTPNLNAYQNRISGLPVLLLMALMLVVTLLFCWRKIGMPGEIKLFAGTRWPVIAAALIAAGAAFLFFGARGQAVATKIYGPSGWHITFLPQTLATVLVYAATWAALEEVVFRGYVTGVLSRRFSALWLVNILQAIAFSVEHIPKYLREPTSNSILLCNLAFMFAFGLVFGGLRLRYRNLGAPWLVHTAYNVGAFYALHANTFATLAALKSM
ncbi:CPBP family intramembrane metalloprotease [bacterium]|nr:CPBP family intramembrane metalloprotease [bacterium]